MTSSLVSDTDSWNQTDLVRKRQGSRWTPLQEMLKQENEDDDDERPKQSEILC